jgi:hypothetical protein
MQSTLWEENKNIHTLSIRTEAFSIRCIIKRVDKCDTNWDVSCLSNIRHATAKVFWMQGFKTLDEAKVWAETNINQYLIDSINELYSVYRDFVKSCEEKKEIENV